MKMKLTIALFTACLAAPVAAQSESEIDILTKDVHKAVFTGGFSSSDMIISSELISGWVEGPCEQLDDVVWQLSGSTALNMTETEQTTYNVFTNANGEKISQLANENYCQQFTVQYKP